MKLLVLYQSRYGSTARYAKALAEELGCDAVPLNEARPSLLAEYEGIIVGTGIYAGLLNGRKELARLAPALAGKKLAVFTVGVTSPKEEEKLNEVRAHGLPQILLSSPAFHCKGNIDMHKLSLLHRTIIKGMVSQLQKLPDDKLTEANFHLLAAVERPIDYIDTQSIQPLISLVKSWKQ